MTTPTRENLELEQLIVDENEISPTPGQLESPTTTASVSEKEANSSPKSAPKAGLSIPFVTDNHGSFQSPDEDKSKTETPLWSESDLDFVLPIIGSVSQSNASQVGSPFEQLPTSGIALVNNPSAIAGLDNNDDGFHATPHTLIMPAATTAGVEAPRGSVGSVRRRFTVSPAQGIPGSASLRKHMIHSGVPSTHSSHHSQIPSRQQSTSTVTQSSRPTSQTGEHSPEVQFKLSDMSLHKEDQREPEQPLLDRHFEDDVLRQTGK